nr:nitroreductase family deazaflavin-dependent oxidoreductase [Saccharomonospora halophila]
MRNPLTALARVLGTRTWVLRRSAGIVEADRVLHRVSRGRVSLVGLAGLPSVHLTTLGRRSGAPRGTNLLSMPDGAGYVVVGSNWGRARDPGWTFNLRAQPEATVTVAGREIPVRARELHGAEYDRMWRRLLAYWPGYGRERDTAGRDLPIFVLGPVR